MPRNNIALRGAIVNMRRAGHRLPKKLPAQLQPDAIRREYLSRIIGILSVARAGVKQIILPQLKGLVFESRLAKGNIHHDSPVDIKAMFKKTRQYFSVRIGDGDIEKVTEKIARSTAIHNSEQLGKQIHAAIGVQVPLQDPFLNRRIAEFNAENVALIQSIPEQYFSQIERLVQSTVASGIRAEEIAKQIQNRYDVSESRAALIARDQIGKFNGQLNEARQTQIGIDSYIWNTVHDNRVRPEHEELDGKKFLWSSPPAEGHPGTPINCRCFADPDFSALLPDI